MSSCAKTGFPRRRVYAHTTACAPPCEIYPPVHHRGKRHRVPRYYRKVEMTRRKPAVYKKLRECIFNTPEAFILASITLSALSATRCIRKSSRHTAPPGYPPSCTTAAEASSKRYIPRRGFPSSSPSAAACTSRRLYLRNVYPRRVCRCDQQHQRQQQYPEYFQHFSYDLHFFSQNISLSP